jgi:hypothetical protein
VEKEEEKKQEDKIKKNIEKKQEDKIKKKFNIIFIYMGIDKWIFIITIFLVFDTYHDGKYTQWLISGKKYYRMIMYAFLGLSLYMFIRKHPNESKSMLTNVSDLVKYMPIDNNSKELFTPFIDFTNFNNNINLANNIPHTTVTDSPQLKRMMGSGRVANNRSVSGSKKKYIASIQSWKCGYCTKQLDYTYEVDHKIELQHGGTNHVDNLVACCTDCHKKKTFANKL